MRGSLKLHNIQLLLLGIIPADAGLTISICHVYVLYRDHPRGCGAHEARDVVEKAMVGSSPRMRGSLTPAATAS